MQRGLEIINMISEERPRIRVDEIMDELGCSQASAYRYLESLASIGLITAVGGGQYGIGPRVVELDRILQRTDPMVLCSREVMRELSEAQPNSLVRLCSIQGDAVICLHSEGTQIIDARGFQVDLFNERGVKVSLFRNAASLAILSLLPPARARAIYLDHSTSIQSAGLGDNWKDFRAQLNRLRRRGYSSTVGRNNPALAAVAVPLCPPEGAQGHGSLSRVFPREWLERMSIEDLVPEMQEGRRVIEAAMARMLRGCPGQST
ncbi:MAG: helix-turn-helix domain-containing protein [Rhodobacteraceae bacterium]|nr:helix-turn-helix domain-containing protein [Paracoccaceae bacterium]